eukprot:TRINITY_DN6066_c0_g1_i12.p1 TRINITY_DN6066_c0_g1~~TRINITY_DN6066_c0_g1_i12.p1  ORF type:complete len:458 (-),score=97.02 TRINITY_DN6066_c0_g1_i12:147-1520(-)
MLRSLVGSEMCIRDRLGSCTRCVSSGTGKSILLDGINDMIKLTTSAPLLASGDTGFSVQAWVWYGGGSGHTTSFTYENVYNFSAANSQIGAGSSGAAGFDPVLSYSSNRSGTLGFLLGIEPGGVLVAGGTLVDASSTETSFYVRAFTSIVPNRWTRLSATFTASSSVLSLWWDAQKVAAATVASGVSQLVQQNATMTLGGNLLGGALNGRVREVRFWDSVLSERQVLDGDCTGKQPAVYLGFAWDPAAAAGDGCPDGDYCRTWASPATCNSATHIGCGTAAAVTVQAATGSFGNGSWMLEGASEMNDWALGMFDGAGYWNQLGYGADQGPCTDSPNCIMFLSRSLALPTPVFRYITGMVQSHLGTSCTGTPVAKVLLNGDECLQQTVLSNQTVLTVASSGSSYNSSMVWDCQNLFVGAGLQQIQTIDRAAGVSCATPASGPGLLLSTEDTYIYVRES